MRFALRQRVARFQKLHFFGVWLESHTGNQAIHYRYANPVFQGSRWWLTGAPGGAAQLFGASGLRSYSHANPDAYKCWLTGASGGGDLLGASTLLSAAAAPDRSEMMPAFATSLRPRASAAPLECARFCGEKSKSGAMVVGSEPSRSELEASSRNVDTAGLVAGASERLARLITREIFFRFATDIDDSDASEDDEEEAKLSRFRSASDWVSSRTCEEM